MPSAVTLERLVKTFDTHRAVDGVSLTVPEGSIFGLLGRNGAGKTTSIRMLMDIIRPDSGRVEVLGAPRADDVKDRIGYLPEERGLYPKMKVLDQLQFAGTLKGMDGGEARRRAGEWLERLELGEYGPKKVEELSKGMQQKVQLIAALLSEPELLILDEPFSGMDPVNQDVFKDLILERNRAGASIIFSTHVMESAEKLCDRIALIDHGRVLLDGPIQDIKERFGRNAVLLEYDGDGSFVAGLPGVKDVNDYQRYVEVRLEDDADPQVLLAAVAGRLTVRRFEIVAPTLHSIFVQTVGGDAHDA